MVACLFEFGSRCVGLFDHAGCAACSGGGVVPLPVVTGSYR